MTRRAKLTSVRADQSFCKRSGNGIGDRVNDLFDMSNLVTSRGEHSCFGATS